MAASGRARPVASTLRQTVGALTCPNPVPKKFRVKVQTPERAIVQGAEIGRPTY